MRVRSWRWRTYWRMEESNRENNKYHISQSRGSALDGEDHIGEWRNPSRKITKITFPSQMGSLLTVKRRGKARSTKTNFLQSLTLESPIDPWGLCILSLILWEMTCKINLWHIYDLELRWKHLPMWSFIHLVRFSSVRLDWVFLLMFFYKRNANVWNLNYGYEKFYLHVFISL